MKAQGVWDAIELEGSVDKSKHKMARVAICQGISEETLLQIGVKRTTKETWDALKMLNHGADKVKELWEKASTKGTVFTKYIQLASTIEEFGDLTTKSIEEITGSLKVHEEWLRGRESRVDEHVLLAQGDWRRGRGRGRSFGRGRGRGGEKSRFDINKIMCYACHKYGHFASDCKTREERDDKTHLAEEVEEEAILL
ncbi:PREDICTED: uncharacterized protein LOC104808360 [Tarenaya hassleriana]|uniref:uncharacterized protein LOC104808360 n=1 Tax=Tarenaya hassleriana TaxID=28532 RepID=UPI00053C2750|nr:PREDICTED: uncharacterized protein LOC104808360 [Tarenaya hassleriana]